MKSETKLFNAKSEEGGTELKNLIHYCCKVKIEHDFSPSVVKISLSKKLTWSLIRPKFRTIRARLRSFCTMCYRYVTQVNPVSYDDYSFELFKRYNQNVLLET